MRLGSGWYDIRHVRLVASDFPGKEVEGIKTGDNLKFARWDRFRGSSGGSHQDQSQCYNGNGEY
jgi:hypothetical protein